MHIVPASSSLLVSFAERFIKIAALPNLMQYSRYELSKEPDFSIESREALSKLEVNILADIPDPPGKEAFVHPRLIESCRPLKGEEGVIRIRCLKLDPMPMPSCEMPLEKISQYRTILVDDDAKGNSTASGLSDPAPRAVGEVESTICAPARDRIRKGLKDLVYTAFPLPSARDYQGEIYMGPQEDRFILVVYKEGSLVSKRDASLLVKLNEWVENVKIFGCRSGLYVFIKRLGVKFKKSDGLSIIYTQEDPTEPFGFKLEPEYLRRVEWVEEQIRKKLERDDLIDVKEKVTRFVEFKHVKDLSFLLEY